MECCHSTRIVVSRVVRSKFGGGWCKGWCKGWWCFCRGSVRVQIRRYLRLEYRDRRVTAIAVQQNPLNCYAVSDDRPLAMCIQGLFVLCIWRQWKSQSGFVCGPPQQSEWIPFMLVCISGLPELPPISSSLYCTGDTHTFEIVRDAYPVTMKDGFWKSTLSPKETCHHTFLTKLQSGITSSTHQFDVASMATIDYCAATWTTPCTLAQCLYPKVFNSWIEF